MATLAKYILAKYVGDPMRMEPINIGIFAWAGGKTFAMFMPVEQAASYVNEISTYKRWVSYWQETLAEKSIRIGRRAPISKDDPKFLDEFMLTQSGNYLLQDAGEIVHSVRGTQVQKACEFLYSRLVDRKASSNASLPNGEYTPEPKPLSHQSQLSASDSTDSCTRASPDNLSVVAASHPCPIDPPPDSYSTASHSASSDPDD